MNLKIIKLLICLIMFSCSSQKKVEERNILLEDDSKNIDSISVLQVEKVNPQSFDFEENDFFDSYGISYFKSDSSAYLIGKIIFYNPNQDTLYLMGRNDFIINNGELHYVLKNGRTGIDLEPFYPTNTNKNASHTTASKILPKSLKSTFFFYKKDYKKIRVLYVIYKPHSSARSHCKVIEVAYENDSLILKKQFNHPDSLHSERW